MRIQVDPNKPDEWSFFNAKTGLRLYFVLWADDETHQVGWCACAMAFKVPTPLPWCDEKEAQKVDAPKVIINPQTKTVVVNVKDEEADNALWNTDRLERIDP